MSVGGLVPRALVGLLAAVGAAMSALVAFTHGALTWIAILYAVISTGLAAGHPFQKSLQRLH